MRYKRAGTSSSAACPHCGDQLLCLRWGHEARCSQFSDRQRARSIRAAFAVLILALVLLALPAHAQVDLGVADKLAGGTAEYVLAVGCVLSWLVSAYLFKQLMDAKAENRADAGKHHAETVETLTSVVTLSVKSADGLQVLEKAMDHFTQRRE